MKRIILTIVAFMVAATCLMKAEMVTKIEAERIARKKLPGELRLVLVDEGDAFYVFNRGEKEGFVIVAGTDLAEPILAYAMSGSFVTKGMPENITEWMNAKGEEIKMMRNHKGYDSRKKMRIVEGLGTKVLDTPDWDQEAPYNGKCPILEGFQFYTGCTITATAIVMGYHRWPECGVGTLSGYICRDLGMDVPGVTLGEKYEWDKMPYLDGGNGPDLTDKESCDAVALIMQHLGVMLRAQYYWTKTGAMPDALNLKLPRHFGYDENAMYLNHDKFSEERWAELLREEIDEGRPVIFVGYTTEYGGEGHAFVIDGYDDNGLFSVNWGWGGRSNGFYSLQWMMPGDQGVGGYDGGYRYNQTAVTHLMPKGIKVEKRERLQFTLTPYVSVGLRLRNEGEKIVKGGSISVTGGMVMNLGTQRFTGETALVIVDRWDKIKETLFTTPLRTVDAGTGWMPLDEWRDSVRVELQNDIEPGDRIRLVYKSDMTGEWCAVTSNEPDGPWEIVLKGIKDMPTDVNDVGTDMQNLDNVAVGKNCINIDMKETERDWMIYDTGGRCVASGLSNACVPLKSGVYIVRIGEEAMKVMVR